MSDYADDLKSLHTALIDSREGYEEALQDAEGHGLTPLFREMIALRTGHHRQIDGLLRAAGETPDESGSFMATVHRTIIKARSLFTGLGPSVLPGLIDGEKRILGYYDEVLKGGASSGDGTVLNAQRSAVASKIAEMEALVPKS